MHMDISWSAAELVPDEMAGWRAYASLLSRHSIGPDLWKGADPSEGPRHYLEPESLAGVAVTHLPQDLAAYYQVVGARPAERTGIAPWIILDLQKQLTKAMAENRWDDAATLASAMGHYVGDIHQPLHCTSDFDGSHGRFTGVHLRWEVEMPKGRWNRSMLRPAPPVFLANPWMDLLTWIETSHSLAPQILDADRTARKKTESDVQSPKYYWAMWYESKDLMQSQASAAASHLASLWYTAWVNAGKPPIPPPPESIPDASIHLKAAGTARKAFSQWSVPLVLVSVFAVAGMWIVAKSLYPKRPSPK
ncbi:MAG: hypothetical protein V2A34_07110 [Lentisphaerota bacterium]